MGQEKRDSGRRGPHRIWRVVIGFILVAAVLFWAALFTGVAKLSIWSDRTLVDLTEQTTRDVEKNGGFASDSAPPVAHGAAPSTAAAGAGKERGHHVSEH